MDATLGQTKIGLNNLSVPEVQNNVQCRTPLVVEHWNSTGGKVHGALEVHRSIVRDSRHSLTTQF